MTDFIPQIQPWIDHVELEELQKVIDSTYITEHEATREFEAIFRDFTGAKNVVAYSNGTTALIGALLALELKPGDEVIVPNLTFVATLNSVILAGGTPVLADIAPDSWHIDPAQIKAKITPRTRGIIPVHLYGSAANLDEIMAIAKEHNLFVLEDAAQAVGVHYSGRHVGTFGNIGMLSFYANKTMTTAEGGILLTNDDALAARLYQIKNHGRSQKGVFIHETIGYNFSFSDLHAAIGLAQLKKLSRILERKSEIYKRYEQGLSGIPQLTFCPTPQEVTLVPWFSNVHVPDAEALGQHLETQNIGSRRFFYPLHMQPCYQGRFGTDADYPCALKAFQTGLSLPSAVGLTNEQQDYVIQTIRTFFA
ncbi:DegT/DnrJ/EryC1/StrS family aminotransferase [Patescibacteria group bacterium]|nr:DegT/DnrJ/EryC1/StrS family aminotransferase [Patescibacteria group bacterium]